MSNVSTSRRFLSSRTYGRNSQKYVDSSKAFDDAVKIKSSTFNIKAVPTITKWGKLTFTSSKSTDAEKSDSRKRKLVDEPEDPFSFEPSRKYIAPSRMVSVQKKAKYKYRMWNDAEEEKSIKEDQGTCSNSNLNQVFGFEMDDMSIEAKPNVISKSLSSVDQVFDQVVKDVKQAHECQESGETQEFTDDIEYIMDGLDKNQKSAIRCLSALSLVTKCTSSVFRMHLRAHGILSRIFGALADSPDCPALALCVACLFMLMSRDRFSIDLEKSSYKLMLKLLSVDDTPKQNSNNSSSKRYLTSSAPSFFKSRHSLKQYPIDKEYQNVQMKIHNLCTKPQNLDKPIMPDLTLSSTITSKLAMEALLKFSSRKDVDFFKEDLRELGGLDKIIDAACLLIGELPDIEVNPSENCLRLLQNIEMFLRAFENVTCLNAPNQNHLLMYRSAIITTKLNRCLKLCCLLIPESDFEEVNGKLNRSCSGNTVYSCLLSVLNVFVNLTNDNVAGCSKVGSVPGLIATLTDCILNVFTQIPLSCHFDFIVLCLGLLINLVENCRSNLRAFLQVEVKCKGSNETSLRALGELFSSYYDAAKTFEEEHDAELERAEPSQNDCDRSLTGGDCSGEWVETEAGVEWVSHQTSQSQNYSVQERHHVNSMFSQDSDQFNRALHRAGRHMEDSIVAAYISLFIGCLIKHDFKLVEEIRDTLPDFSFEPLSRMLKKFHNFMNITHDMRSSCSKSILQIISVLESC